MGGDGGRGALKSVVRLGCDWIYAHGRLVWGARSHGVRGGGARRRVPLIVRYLIDFPQGRCYTPARFSAARRGPLDGSDGLGGPRSWR